MSQTFRTIALFTLGLVLTAGLIQTTLVQKENHFVRQRWNVVVLSTDTTRADHLPFYGYHRNTAPELTKLAQQGIVFENAIAAHANTAPSHASVFTGLWPNNHGITLNGKSLKKNTHTLGSILQKEGYETAAFISGGTLKKHTRLHHGFGTYEDNIRFSRAAADTANIAMRWLRSMATSKKPFFMFMHSFDPHQPYLPELDHLDHFRKPEIIEYTSFHNKHTHGTNAFDLNQHPIPEHVGKELIDRYDADIHQSDQALGRVVQALRQMNLLDRTIIVLMSDHGESHTERNWKFDHGAQPYEEQLHVPLVLRFPGAQLRQRVEPLVHHVDVTPTVLDALGIQTPVPMDGRSLIPLLTHHPTKADWNRIVYSHCRTEPVRMTNLGQSFKQRGLAYVLRTQTHKYIEFPKTDGTWFPQMFDLVVDPEEKTDISQIRTPLRNGLEQQLHQWRDQFSNPSTPDKPMTPEILEQLKALGYVH